jgi:hypothetical protein
MFRNKTVVEGATPQLTTNDPRREKFINYFKRLINQQNVNKNNKTIDKLRRHMDKYSPSIYDDCTKIILDLNISRVDKLKKIMNFIILPYAPNDNVDQAPEKIKELYFIIKKTNIKNWEKIKKIKEITNYKN